MGSEESLPSNTRWRPTVDPNDVRSRSEPHGYRPSVTRTDFFFFSELCLGVTAWGKIKRGCRGPFDRTDSHGLSVPLSDQKVRRRKMIDRTV